ncbi:MAG TPA: hypothetical protein V6C97_16095 [Oculatellaceae cyanobacterium]
MCCSLILTACPFHVSIEPAAKKYWPSECGTSDKISKMHISKFIVLMQQALDKHQRANPPIALRSITLPRHTPSRFPSGGGAAADTSTKQKGQRQKHRAQPPKR